MSVQFFTGLKPGDRITVEDTGKYLAFANPAEEVFHLDTPEYDGPCSSAGTLEGVVDFLNSALALAGLTLVLIEVWDGDEQIGPATFAELQGLCENWNDDFDLTFDRYIFECRIK